MSRTVLVCFTSAGGVTQATGTFVSVEGTRVANSSGTGLEVSVASKIGVAGKLDKLGVKINGTGTARTLVSRKNSAAGNCSVTMTNSLAGTYEQSTPGNSDSLAIGDTFCSLLTVTGGPTSMYWTRFHFTGTNGHANMMSVAGEGAGVVTASSTQYWNPGGSNSAFAATESECQTKIKVPGTANYFHAKVFTAATNAFTMRLRKNTANGNGNLSIAGGVTGVFADTSSTDVLAVDDLVAIQIITGATTGPTISGTGFTIANTDPVDRRADYTSGRGTHSVNGTSFPHIVGSNTANLTETDNQFLFGLRTSFSFLRSKVSTNTFTATRTLTLRKNGADGNNTISIGASTTGTFEDTTHTDEINDTDLVNLKLVSSTAGSSVMVTSITAQTLDTPVKSNVNSYNQAVKRASYW